MSAPSLYSPWKASRSTLDCEGYMEPADRVEHAVSTCPDCGAHPRWGIDASAREVIDIPVSAVPVTEHVVIAQMPRPELKRSNAPLE